MKATALFTGCLGLVVGWLVVGGLGRAGAAETPIKLELVEVKKVWDRAPHNAFTDLVRFKDRWYLTFREAQTHSFQPPCGNIRVLVSEDGRSWDSAALMEYGTELDDLRDPKLSVTADGRLLLLAALAPKEDRTTRQPFAWLSNDGKIWDGPHKVGESGWWLWRVVWHPDGTAYGLGYLPKSGLWGTRLYRSRDGLHYETLLPRWAPQDRTGEAAMLFRKDGSAVALIRRDGPAPNGAVVGTSQGDYTKWTFRELEQRMGGPQIVELPSSKILAAGRLHDGKVRTALGLLEPEAGRFTELLALPSGGDTSYPGLVWHDRALWVSYYSSHEGRTSVYLAKVRVAE